MNTTCKCGQPAVAITTSGVPLCALMALVATFTAAEQVTS